MRVFYILAAVPLLSLSVFIKEERDDQETARQFTLPQLPQIPPQLGQLVNFDPAVPLLTFLSALVVSTGREILQATTTTVAPPALTPEEQIVAANDDITAASADLAKATANIDTASQTTAALNSIADSLTSAGSTPRSSITTCQDFSDKLKEILDKLNPDDVADAVDAVLPDVNVADALNLIGVILNMAIPCSPSEVDVLIIDILPLIRVAKGNVAVYKTKNEDLISIAEEIIEKAKTVIRELNAQLIALGQDPISLTSKECGKCIFPFVYMGVKSDRCTTIDGADVPWCPTELDENGEVLIDDNGTYSIIDCTIPTCPGLEFTSKPISVNSLNVANTIPCYCGVPNRSPAEDRIVGGTKTEVGEYPWQVSIGHPAMFGSPYEVECGGVLVADIYVLTSASCIQDIQGDMDELEVRIGETSLDEQFEAKSFAVNIAEITLHPNFNDTEQYFENDIAVLKLGQAVDLFSYPNIKPACLPHPQSSGEFSGEMATLAGWGFNGNVSDNERLHEVALGHKTAYLKEVDVTVLTTEECIDSVVDAIFEDFKDDYSNQTDFEDYVTEVLEEILTDDKICAANTNVASSDSADICFGDEGGPLIAADPNNNNAMTVIGVSTRPDFLSSDMKPCHGPTLHTNVAKVMDWLLTTMSNLESRNCNIPPSPLNA